MVCFLKLELILLLELINKYLTDNTKTKMNSRIIEKRNIFFSNDGFVTSNGNRGKSIIWMTGVSWLNENFANSKF